MKHVEEDYNLIVVGELNTRVGSGKEGKVVGLTTGATYFAFLLYYWCNTLCNNLQHYLIFSI